MEKHQMSTNAPMRRVFTNIASPSDLTQCIPGLEALIQAEENNLIEVLNIPNHKELAAASIHRHTEIILHYLKSNHHLIDIIITGAGWANHLTGMLDSYLRYTLENYHTVIIGVGFEADTDRRNSAAETSITEVPGTQAIYQDSQGFFFGEDGFHRACKFAISDKLPQIVKPKPKEQLSFTLREALQEAKKRKAQKSA